MIKNLSKVLFLGLVCTLSAIAADKGGGVSMSGSIEAGVGYGWNPNAAKGMHWFVDGVHMKHHYDVSDKTKVKVHNAFGVNATSVAPASSTGQNGTNFFSAATLAAGTMSFSNLGASIEHKCGDGFYTTVGHIRNMTGLESWSDRYDMSTYYYSRSYRLAQGYGWNYDLGVNFRLVDILPGTLGVSLVDGRVASTRVNTINTPAAAVYWSYEYKNGDMTLTPVITSYMGQWRGGPKDLNLSAGAMFKMGSMWANAEFVYAKVGVATETKDWSINVEPGFDLGFADFSAKYEVFNNKVGTAAGTSDMNLGAALAKNYTEKYRVKLAYQHTNLSGKLGAHGNDFRLLFATKW